MYKLKQFLKGEKILIEPNEILEEKIIELLHSAANKNLFSQIQILINQNSLQSFYLNREHIYIISKERFQKRSLALINQEKYQTLICPPGFSFSCLLEKNQELMNVNRMISIKRNYSREFYIKLIR